MSVVVAWRESCAADTPAGNTRLELLRITPEGDGLSGVDSIVLEFSRPVVPVGRMDRTPAEIGVKISPALACEWRWLNTSTLACKLAQEKMPKRATRYHIAVEERFDTTVSEGLAKAYESSFSTELPDLPYPWIDHWDGPAQPVLLVRPNMPIDKDPLREHLVFKGPDGKLQPVVLSEAPRDEDEEAWQPGSGSEKRDRWLVSSKEPLREGVSYSLVLTAGLRGKEGDLALENNKEVLSLRTFPAFELLGVSCFSLSEAEVFVPSAKTKGAKKAERCNPLNRIALEFSVPVSLQGLADGVQVAPPLVKGEGSGADLWSEAYSEPARSIRNVEGARYPLTMPYGLKAVADYSVVAKAGGIRDMFGRTLPVEQSVSFSTDHRLPRLVLDNQVSVLEKDADSQLPIIVNNVSKVDLKYRTVTSAASQEGLSRSYTPYDVKDIAYAYPINVRELLGGRSGIVQGEMLSQPKTSDESRWFLSQVTPFSVHVKLGHFSSLAWVTSLSTGLPIEGATVSIVEDTLRSVSASPKVLASGATDASGVSLLPGTEAFDPARALASQWDQAQPRLMVRVAKGDDIALLPIGYEFEVYSEGVWPSSNAKYGHLRSWGTTAQGLYKAGDSVQFSLWVRNQDDRTLTTAPRSAYTLEVTDPLGKVVFTVPQITLSEFGGYSGEFRTDASAAVGWYEFSLKPSFSTSSITPLRVLLSDFTPAPFKVTSRLDRDQYSDGDKSAVSTEARLHAGGPYASAPLRVSASVRGKEIVSADPKFARFSFDSDDTEFQVFESELRLNSAGDAQAQFALPESKVAFGLLRVESAVRDDRGKNVAAVATASYASRDRFGGLDYEGWFLQAGRQERVDALVLDGKLAVAAGASVTVAVERKENKISRVKSAGNAYVSRVETEWVPVQSCSLVSALEPVSCAFTPPSPGDYRITATVKDAKGREHASTLEMWAAGKGFVAWGDDSTSQLKIEPEKLSYKVGETARFVVRNPFPKARALFTTERYGIMSSWTKEVSDGAEVVEVKVTRDHIPGFFFSATLSSPRVDKPIENQVDLGKPTFRMGYAQVEVVDVAKQLTVDVKPRGEVFKPREAVTVDLAARASDGSKREMQYAVTVLDEAVFDLLQSGRAYFDPYRGFYVLDGLDVENFSLLRYLVGRQKFEKKGASAGGDGGGKLDMRSLMKFVSYWNPALTSKADGTASFTFDAPDNLTGWKVFAMAFTKGDQMGLGEGGFKVNKDTEVRAALPNLVREGDRFSAIFTVLNRTTVARDLKVEVRSEGDALTSETQSVTVHAEPFVRVPVSLALQARKPGEGRLVASASDAVGGDALTEKLVVLSDAQLQTAATFGSSDGKDVTEKVSFPAGIRTDAGSVGVVLSPTVLGSLEGAFAYMRDYPYDCWEQKLSKGVMASHYLSLREYLPKSFEWKDAKEHVQRTLEQMPSHQAPSGGMCFFAPQDERADIYLSAYTALALGWLKDAGYQVPVESEKRLIAFLQGVLRNDSLPGRHTPEMRSSVRAVALEALAQRGLVPGKELQRYRTALKEMSLFGKAALLSAAVSAGASDALQSEVFSSIAASGKESGGKLSFVERVDTNLGFMLDSSMRTECAILSSYLSYAAKSGRGREVVSPLLPKMVRAITLERKRKDRWENTQENMFCLAALAKYAQAYERGEPKLALSASVGKASLGQASFQSFHSDPVELSRAIGEADVGRTEELEVRAQGQGRYYYSGRVSFAPREHSRTATNAGIELRREYSVKRGGEWQILKEPVTIEQGELVKVDLFVRLPGPHNFVVVNDPIPGGLEPVNRELKTSSEIDAQAGAFVGSSKSFWFDLSDWIDFGQVFWSFYHRELRHSAARFYSSYLPAGNYHLSYTAQAIAAGEFVALPAHAEEMYDPDVFGETGADRLVVSAMAGRK